LFARRLGRGLWSWFHWPIVSLMAGIAMGYMAISATQQPTGHAILFFLLSAVLLCAGLLGLFLHSSKEPNPVEPEPDNRPLRVYRQTKCAIDGDMVQKQCHTLATLEHRVRENNWSLDWDAYRQHLDRGSDAMERSDFADAYHEHGQAMLLLMEVLAAYRHKEEAFKPLW